MSNIYYGRIDAAKEFVDLEEYAQITLTVGTAYLLQFQGCATVQLADSQPSLESGGFLLQNNQIFQWTPNGTDKLWIRTWGAVTFLNIGT